MKNIKRKVLVAMSLKDPALSQKGGATGQAGGERRTKKVLVAMSGGVDSSVAALLLKRAGFEVAGAHMKCWDYNDPECTGAEDEKSARLAASHIKIPFYVFDFRKEYKKKVFDYFLKEQKAGLTPNPDIMCNKFIKFGLFLEKAQEFGFDYVATGHYVRLRRKFQAPNSKSQTNSKSQISNSKLFIAKDKNKDQSYFLAFVELEALDRVIFPLGNYTKSQVRAIARKAKLPTAFRPESQGLCFVGEVKMENFLKRYIKSRPGLIVDAKGNKMGWHQGLWFYTIGQRKGIGLPDGPYFVLKKDLKNNVLVVTKNEKDLLKKELVAKNLTWLSGKVPRTPLKVKVKIRYRAEPVAATLTSTLNPKPHTLIKFDKPQRAITSGQAAVFYKNRELLGGGIIV